MIRPTRTSKPILRNVERKRQSALATGTGNPGETAVAPPEPAPDQILRLPPDYDDRPDVGRQDADSRSGKPTPTAAPTGLRLVRT